MDADEQHRIFLAPARPALALAEGHAHWHSQHLALMLQLPELRGYVQDRPRPEWWVHLPYLACSETWFADREAERAAYASDWYRDQIAVDEARMFARDAAWNSPVLAVETLRDGPLARFRTLAFGATPDGLDGVLFDGRAEILRLLRSPPAGGERAVVCVWADDRNLASQLALRLGGLAFVAEPVVGLAPREAPWIL